MSLKTRVETLATRIATEIKAYRPSNGARAVGKGELVINVKDYGALGNGVADDTTAINNAAAAAFALNIDARLLMPPGTYVTTGTVEIRCHLDAEQATISYSGTGVALRIGSSVSGTVTFRKTCKLPRVICASRPASGWDGTSRGVVLQNLNDCEIKLPFVQNFERGLVVYGFGQGTAYCVITLGSIWDCRKSLIFDADSTGWANQNVVVGGRIAQGISRGAVNDDTGAAMFLIGETSGVSPNNNTFIGTSVEGDNPSYYRIDCNGRYNTWLNCRFEDMGSENRVIWRAGASGNYIDHGYEAWRITETYESGSFGNELRSRTGAFIDTDISTSGFSVPTNTTTTFLTINAWTNNSWHCPYNSSTGLWTPRQGMWEITATIGVASTTGTDLQVRLLAAGGRVLDVDVAAVRSAVVMLKLHAVERFTGNESLAVQIQQSTSVTRSLVGTTGFTNIHAHWVGP